MTLNLDELRARHVGVWTDDDDESLGQWCRFCSSAYVYQPWPCDTARLLDLLTVERVALALGPVMVTWPPPFTARERARDKRDVELVAADVLTALLAEPER